MIDVEELRFAYRGSTEPAVRGITFSIAEGEVFGFLGPSGAGKSTTQNILIGLLKGYAGRVSVMGKPLGEWDSGYYERIGVSFESPNHYLKLTGRENLDYFQKLYQVETERPEDVLSMVGLGDAADMRVAEYSKGMKNRLNFARSMLHRPRLWFLDEPTAGLDPVNARNIMNIVDRRRAEGVTTFLTTHDMTVADELCDRVGFIMDGELALVDSPKELKRRFGKRTVRVELDDDGVSHHEFPLDDLGRNPDFTALIRDHRVESIHSEETTLANVFIEVTGRGLG